MKRVLFIGILLLAATHGGSAQDKKEETRVKSITYKKFLKSIWDFEKDPSTFVYKGKTAAIVDFYADWCGPCRKVGPIMEKLAEKYAGKLTVYKVNVDQEKDLAMVFQVRSIPMVLFIPLKGQPMIHTGAMSEADFFKIVEEKLFNSPK